MSEISWGGQQCDSSPSWNFLCGFKKNLKNAPSGPKVEPIHTQLGSKGAAAGRCLFPMHINYDHGNGVIKQNFMVSLHVCSSLQQLLNTFFNKQGGFHTLSSSTWSSQTLLDVSTARLRIIAAVGQEFFNKQDGFHTLSSSTWSSQAILDVSTACLHIIAAVGQGGYTTRILHLNSTKCCHVLGSSSLLLS
uniref:Uncharacterized protein n=1 Tax=Lutzomyia longipalpis TaxID=7200 RepID=A0A1B0CCG5_LUTLO